VWHRGQAQDLPIVQMLRQPPVLGFEVENLAALHQGKEHKQPLMLIHEGMATMGASALGLYKAVKQGPEKSDIVGEGWQSHQGTSWEMGIFHKRGPDLQTMSSLNAFVHTPQLSHSMKYRYVILLMAYFLSHHDDINRLARGGKGCAGETTKTGILWDPQPGS
jgi:hypothetical protein